MKTTPAILTRVIRLTENKYNERHLYDAISSKLFTSIFGETTSVKQTNMIIESFVDSMIQVSTDVDGKPRDVKDVVAAMKQIHPKLSQRVFAEDSDSTKMPSTSRSFTVVYLDSKNTEHSIVQMAISPRSIKRQLEKAGYEVKDIILNSTGESVMNETVSAASMTKAAERVLADIEHLSSAQDSNVFNKSLRENVIASHKQTLDQLIKTGEQHGLKWNSKRNKFTAEQKQQRTNTNRFTLADVFAK